MAGVQLTGEWAGGLNPACYCCQPPAHVISGPEGDRHNPPCCQVEGLLQLFTGLVVSVDLIILT